MSEPLRFDPEIVPRVGRLKAIDVDKVWARWLIGFGPRLMPVRRVPGVAFTKERAGSVHVRTYRPERPSGAGLMWIHGGGLIGGAAAMDDLFCADTAKQLGLTIVSVEYRLAPKHPFPAAHDDVYAGWTWFAERLEAWGLDRDRIAVGGQSAGGGLSAGLVQRLTDEGHTLAAQWLWTPMLDDRTAMRTELDDLGHLVWDNRANRYGWNAYLRSVDREAPPPYASPGRREDLTGLPPTWVYASDVELFHDEVVDYATRLRAAGVETTLDIAPGVPHAVESTATDTQAAATILAKGRAWLAAHLGSTTRDVRGSDDG
jgi:acetyl esterase/lipase